MGLGKIIDNVKDAVAVSSVSAPVIDADATDKVLMAICGDCERTIFNNACNGGERCVLDILSKLETTKRGG